MCIVTIFFFVFFIFCEIKMFKFVLIDLNKNCVKLIYVKNVSIDCFKNVVNNRNFVIPQLPTRLDVVFPDGEKFG